MKHLIPACAIALALGATAAAQDNTVKSKTKVDADDAHAVTMRGCLQQTADNSGFLLLGGVTSSGGDLTSKSKVKTDVDKDDTTVKGKTQTKVDNDDHKTVGTSGTVTPYTVTAREGVNLAAHAGDQVEITAVMVDAKTGGDDTADVKIKERTKVDNDDSPDAKVQSKTKAELPRGASNRLMALSVRSIGPCGAR